MWNIEHTDEFDTWLLNQDEFALTAIYRTIYVLSEYGPSLGRPYVDHIKQSQHKNMKELRIQNRNRIFRIFFAFDPEQTGILLIAGDKKGNKRFYQKMIPVADRLYSKHIKEIGG